MGGICVYFSDHNYATYHFFGVRTLFIMKSFKRRLSFAWDYFVGGQHRLPRVEIPPDFEYRLPDDSLMKIVADMFTAHGAHSFRAGNWLVIDGGQLFVRAAHLNIRQQPNGLVLQTDFVCLTASGLHIVESFAGIGADKTSALMDACKSFQDASFHVLLVTCLPHDCEHVDREIWTIGGLRRNLTFGWLRIRGHFPHEYWPAIFSAMQSQLECIDLSRGLHWVRYYYAHVPSEDPTIEVLVDNESSQELECAASKWLWPPSDVFYSVRLFFTVQDAPAQPNSEEQQ